LTLEAKMVETKETIAKQKREKMDAEKELPKLQVELGEIDGKLADTIKYLQIKLKNAVSTYNAQPEKRVAFYEKVIQEAKMDNSTEKLSKKKADKIKGAEIGIAHIKEFEYRSTNTVSLVEKAKEDSAKTRDETRKKIDNTAKLLNKLEVLLKVKQKSMDKTRDDIENIKGPGTAEDMRFDINSSRNEDGLTFLSLCAQNNDVQTANLCFKLGADANVECPQGLTALSYARYLQNYEVSDVIAQNGGLDALEGTWNHLESVTVSKERIDWETQLKVANNAAIPADTKLSPMMMNNDDANSSAPLSLDKHDAFAESGIEQLCFDFCLTDPASCESRHIVLMDREVYKYLREAERSQQDQLVKFVEKLRSGDAIGFHHRFVVGVQRERRFEIKCATLAQEPGSNSISVEDVVIFYSPFVESFVDGVTNIGVLFWAITTEFHSQRYKLLIESEEFRRHKILYPNDRFPVHRDYVMELGMDMHLLDLMGTSIFTGRAMDILRLEVESNDHRRLADSDFIPQKRLLNQEQQLQNAIFKSTKQEALEVTKLVADSLPGMSTSLNGGAGTGKTITLIKKLIDEDVTKKVVVISRLPRLISFIKSAVADERDCRNVEFFTYDEMLTAMTRIVKTENAVAVHVFPSFLQVSFAESSNGVSFERDFVGSILQASEWQRMADSSIQPLLLWEAFRVIKSNALCARMKRPMKRDEYLRLPGSYGLTMQQRHIVYDLFLQYTSWMTSGKPKWDEADRVMHVLKNGPTPFQDEDFLSWEERYRRGEPGLVDRDGVPCSPFFYDLVCADEAQDFSELDLSLFIRMSSSVRSLFLGADPAQSVELGIRMRSSTMNGVFHTVLPKRLQVRLRNVGANYKKLP